MTFCCIARGPCIAIGILAAIVTITLVTVLSLQPWNNTTLRYNSAAIAANGYECADIGRTILEQGGSAADAAIATLFCSGVSCAQCMGLGGGFLATVYDATTGRVRSLNARERAPAATTENMFQNESSTVGGLAVAVPGELRGYGELHREYGRLPWSELVLPTAELCRRGHRVNQYMAQVLASNAARIKEEPSMSEVYINPATGEVWQEGDHITLLTLAQTLETIAVEGPEALHNGSLTMSFLQDIQSFGGIISEEDLRNYRPEWQEPIRVNLSNNNTLYTVPLPGSGSILAFILNMLRGYSEVEPSDVAGSNLHWHRVIESFKFGYAKRSGLGDPNRENVGYNISELELNLTSDAWAEQYRSQIDDTRTYNDWRHYGAEFDTVEDHGTAHISVIGPDGSAVALTSTINYIWGAMRRSRSTGILLNNEMDDFAIPGRDNVYNLPPSPANMLAPGLQPLSSMVPTIVLNSSGVPKFVVGAAGGTRITTQIALATLKVISAGQDFPDVIRAPRIHHQLMPMTVEHEIDFSPDTITSLQARGHETSSTGVAGFVAMVGIARDSSGRLVPRTDHRRVGSTAGY